MLKKILLLSVLSVCIAGTSYAGKPGWELMSSGITSNLNAVTAAGSAMYAVGASGKILKYSDNGTGTGWVSQTSGTTWTLYGAYTKNNTVYAVGDYRGIFKSGGNGWTKVNGQTTNYPLYTMGGPDNDTSKYAAFGKNNTIWVLFVPQYYNICMGDNSSFKSQEQHEHSNDLYGSFTTQGQVIVVGSKGFLGYVAKNDFFGHYNLDKWSSPVSVTMRGVWGTDPNNLFAVGDSGTILRKLNGGNWTKMTSNTTASLRAVWGTAMNDVYAVGASGTLMKFNGSTWSKITLPTTQQLNGIAGIDKNEIYIVGNGGTIIRYKGKQTCYLTNGTTGIQIAKADGSGWEICAGNKYSFWCDSTSGLCWQDPPRETYPLSYFDGGDPGLASQDAVRFCQGLQLAGQDNWRLPDIDELRSLVRGNPDTMTGGECPMVVGSLFEDGQAESCMGAEDGQGPGVEGCYWPPQLTGSCHRPDKGTQGVHALETWASDIATNRTDWVASILFDIGGVCYNHVNSYGDVRCIIDAPATPVTCAEAATCAPGETRQCNRAPVNGDPMTALGAQTCNAAGTCWSPCEFTGFTPTPRPSDMCGECDKATLTIRVPEQLAAQPVQLMAFFYEASSWMFPPQGPPDGGTDYNLVQNPDIDIDKPFTMVLPGCTYYREACLVGDYQIYIQLSMAEVWPPLPQNGDFTYGRILNPVTLGSGIAEDIPIDITLEKCVNGSCAVH